MARRAAETLTLFAATRTMRHSRHAVTQDDMVARQQSAPLKAIAKLLLICDGNLCSIRVRWIERVAGKAGRIMTRKAPDILEVTEQRFEELLQRAESNTLRDDDMELMRQIFASYRGFFQMVGDKNTTIARLRKMMFGATTEKSTNVIGDPATDGANNDDALDVANVSSGDVLQNTSADGETNRGDDSSEPSPVTDD